MHSHGGQTVPDTQRWSVRRAITSGELNLELITDGGEEWAIRKGSNLLCQGYHQEITYVWGVLTLAIFGPEENRS